MLGCQRLRTARAACNPLCSATACWTGASSNPLTASWPPKDSRKSQPGFPDCLSRRRTGQNQYHRLGVWLRAVRLQVRRHGRASVQRRALILDIIDAQSKQLVWRSVATGTIDPNASAATRKRKLAEAITEIRAKFSPTAN